MVAKALFTNTLIALPTGLGKTFIAAVVMYNYFRWFPEGNVLHRILTVYLSDAVFYVFYELMEIDAEILFLFTMEI
jgi:ERCC4-related helicase